MSMIKFLRWLFIPRWREIKYELEGTRCLTKCPYNVEAPSECMIIKVYSYNCCNCKHHFSSNKKDKIVNCSYEYDKIMELWEKKK